MSDGHPVGCRLHRAQQQQWVHGVHRVQFFQDMLNILKSHCLVEAQWFDLVGVHFSLCNEVESVDSELLGNPLLDPHHFQPRQVITTTIITTIIIPTISSPDRSSQLRKDCFDVTQFPEIKWNWPYKGKLDWVRLHPSSSMRIILLSSFRSFFLQKSEKYTNCKHDSSLQELWLPKDFEQLAEMVKASLPHSVYFKAGTIGWLILEH